MLRGERIVLRPIEPEHLPNYVRWLGDPDMLEYFSLYRPMNMANEQAWYEAQNKDPSVGFAGFASSRKVVYIVGRRQRPRSSFG
jgi:RimJ/RimL family protein N-acetyltransferase